MNDRFPLVDGFRILRSVGQGGFAQVFLAEQFSLNRQVALKVLDVRLGDEEAQRRFRNECQTVGSLSWHPHVVTVYEAGVTSGSQPYLAMEYLPAGSFEERLEAGPVPVPEVVSLGVQVADALAAAHASGVLHRDVKPANVLVDRFGEGRLADFGIARFGEGTRTATGVISATVSYAAPEILSGHRANEASDLYGLGATLYALLRGSAPFAQSTEREEALVAVIARVATEPPPPLEPHGTPAALAHVVHRLLAKQAADRPASAAEVVSELQAIERRLGLAVTRARAVQPSPPPPPAPAPTVPSRPAPPPPGPAWVPPPPPAGPIRPAGRRSSSVVRAVATGLTVIVLGAVLAWILWPDDVDGPTEGSASTERTSNSSGRDGTSPSSSSSSSPSSSPPTSAAEAVWADAAPPTEPERQLLDQLPGLFSADTRCTAITDADEANDLLNIYPTDRDLASIECTYGDASTIVYSLFASDQIMSEFFDGRLLARQLTAGQGDIGPTAPWQRDYSDDPERGTGRIYGNLRTSPQVRSEVGWIRYGSRTYAYSYRLDPDFAAYFDWWSRVFGGPAR